MKNNILISTFIIGTTLLTSSFASTENNLAESITQKHAITGKLGKVYPNVGQALTQHVPYGVCSKNQLFLEQAFC